MHESRIAYRYKNGEVEGFIGVGFSKEFAERQAVNKIKNKLQFSPNESFMETKLITDSKNLNHEEILLIRSDWELNK